jgi:hypothetical protein
MIHRLFKKQHSCEVEIQTNYDDTPERLIDLMGRYERLMEEYSKLQVALKQATEKQVSSDSLLKTVKEKL